MFWNILLSLMLIFSPNLEIAEPIEQQEKVEIRYGGGGGRSEIVQPRVEFPGREIPTVYLGLGTGYGATSSYLAGFDRAVPAVIASVKVDNPDVLSVTNSDFKIDVQALTYGNASVTVDVYHRDYSDIWTTTIIPFTVTQEVYGQ